MKKTILGLFLTMWINQSYAWESANLSIDYIDVKSEGHVSVYFTSPLEVPNPKNCMQGGTVSWEGNNESSKNFLSTFLTAKTTQANVQIIVDDNTCLWGGWPALLTVRLK